MSITFRDKAELGVEQNYFINGGGESGTTELLTFTTSFTGGVPGTITPGSSFVTLSAVTGSNVLSGNASFQMSVTTATGSTGSGIITTPMTLQDAELGTVIAAAFDYNFVTNPQNVDVSGTSTQTIEVWVYNVGLASWYQPAGYRSINTKGTASQLVPGRTPAITFQSDISNLSNKNQYQLALIVRNDPAGTFSVNLDNFTFGRQYKAYGPVVTDWVSFTATGTNISFTSQSCFYRRIGDSLEVTYGLTVSSVTGSIILDLPSPFVIDTNKLNGAIAPLLGMADADSGSGQYLGAALLSSTTSFAIYGPNNQNIWNATVPVTWTSGLNLRVQILVPIVGFSSDVQLSQDTDTRVVVMTNNGVPSNSILTTPSTITYASPVNYDSHGAFNPSTGIYTVPVSGPYQCTFTARTVNGTGNPDAWFIRNGATDFTAPDGSIGYYIAGSGQEGLSANGLIYCNAGDTLQGRVRNASGADSFNSPFGSISIHRLSGPSVIAANETVAAKYIGDNSGSTLTGGVDPFRINTKIFDTHNAVTTGSAWKFTAPISGKYRFSFSTYVTVNQSDVYIFVNGSSTTEVLIWDLGGTNNIIETGTSLIQLKAGDYLQLIPQNTVTDSNSAAYENFCIERVGN